MTLLHLNTLNNFWWNTRKVILSKRFSFNEEYWNESTRSPISFLPSSLMSSKHLFVSVRMVRSRLEHVQNRLSSAGMFAIMVTSHKIPKKVQEIFLASSHRLMKKEVSYRSWLGQHYIISRFLGNSSFPGIISVCEHFHSSFLSLVVWYLNPLSLKDVCWSDCCDEDSHVVRCKNE